MPPYDSNYKMKPPLREQGDIAAVLEGLRSGAIDAIATDHAPHPGAEKMQEFERCPFGIIGLETAIGLALEKLYHSGKSVFIEARQLVYDWSGRNTFVRAGKSPPR